MGIAIAKECAKQVSTAICIKGGSAPIDRIGYNEREGRCPRIKADVEGGMCYQAKISFLL